MMYEKPEVEVVKFEPEGFMTTSFISDPPLGNFTCGQYKQGGTCSNVSWNATGYTCGTYTNGNCQSVYSPPGSTGDKCYAWKLTCSKF